MIKDRIPYTWTKDEVNVLVEMRLLNHTHSEIAEVLGKKKTTIHNFLSKHSDKLNIPVQQKEDKISSAAWLGPVPYLHWMITKKWSQK